MRKINRFITKAALAMALVAGAAVMAFPANASTISWSLSNVAFNDTRTATGNFTFDTSTHNLTTWNITTSNGPAFSGFTYTPITSTVGIVTDQVFALESSNSELYFTFMTSLGTASAADYLATSISQPYEFSGSQIRFVEAGSYITSDTASATPLPAALPLFATGLGVMGWLARRRKWKRQPQPSASCANQADQARRGRWRRAGGRRGVGFERL
jgi:hypothetical protein